MKTFKRLTAMAVALVFVFTSLIGVTAFAEEDSIFSDVPETNSYYEAITSLVADGVINGYADGTFKPDATITRAEFSKLLAVGSTPVGTAFSQTTTQFSDVADSTSSSAWAIPYIAYAVGIKAINGYEDGTFRPTNPVTYGEAVKMIVCTLGYGSVVDTTLTPWYQGYVDIAFKIGLTKNAFAQGDTPASRALVAQLIYNMQSCKVYVPSPNGGSGSTGNWGSDTGLTNEETDDGVLLGVFDYCLDGTAITKSQVLIDDDIYQIGDLDRDELKELVGYAVSFKYTNTKKPELTRVSKASGENNVTELEDWQIVSVDGDGIEFYEDEDAEDEDEVSKISFDKDLYVVYNGVIVDTDDIDDEFISEYLNVENGSIKLLSNDGNKKSAEVVFVESYITYFVNTVSTADGVTTFYDKYQKHTGLAALSLDKDDVESVQKVSTKGGKLTDSALTGITAKSITSVAIPYGTMEGTKVLVSSVKFTGTVNELSSNYSKIKIGTEYYETSPYFDLLLEKGENVGFEVGDSGTFYLDYLGRIVFYEKTESTNPYALLVQYKSTTGMNASYALNISKSSKDLDMFLLEEKVKINGDTMTAEEAIGFLINNTPNYDEEKPSYIIQPIKYKSKTNSNGDSVVTEIECIDLADPEDGNIVPYAFKNSVNSDKEYFANDGTLTYSKSGYAFKHNDSTQFRMNSSTAVFVVPSDLSKASGYAKKTYSYFTNTASYKVEAYDVDGEIAKLVVVYGSSSKPTIYAQTPVYLVQEVSDKNNADGQPTKNIVYYKAGSSETEEKLVDIDSDALDIADTLEPGDLIKFVTENNEITSIKKVFVAGELLNDTGSFKVDGHHIAKDYETTKDYYQVIYGTVRSLDLDNNTISVIPGIDADVTVDADYETINIDDSTVYYEFENKNGFKITSAGAIAPTFSDYIDSDEDAGRENAKRIVTIIVNKKVTAVYILS
ncbi:MAG: S-layer homology domain-containing protein [Clostridia bacterium]|nr:S-layer homology domain-containing protein [Clostridia bacterium]